MAKFHKFVEGDTASFYVGNVQSYKLSLLVSCLTTFKRRKKKCSPSLGRS